LAEQTGHLLVQFADLLVDQSQFLQRHLQQPPVHSVQLRTGTERVTQLFRGGAQALISQSGQSGWVGFSVKSIREPPAVLPGVRHRGNPSCVPVGRDWTVPVPNATFRTCALRLLASRAAVSSTVPMLPKLVSNIAPSIP